MFIIYTFSLLDIQLLIASCSADPEFIRPFSYSIHFMQKRIFNNFTLLKQTFYIPICVCISKSSISSFNYPESIETSLHSYILYADAGPLGLVVKSRFTKPANLVRISTGMLQYTQFCETFNVMCII